MFCELVGADFRAIVESGDDGSSSFYASAEDGRQYLARGITEADLPAILDDLDDINYHTLMKYLARWKSYTNEG